MERKTSTGTTDDRVRELISPLVDSVARVVRGEPASAVSFDAAVSQLEEKLGLLLREHQGMADDLLLVYEQLCMVFDMTRNLLALRCEEDVLSLFVENLRRSYPDVFLATAFERSGEGSGYVTRGDVDAIPGWIEVLVEETHRERRVGVRDSGDVVGQALDGALLHREEAVAAPIYAGEVFVCVLLLWRRAEHGSVRPWQSGEMMLLDSLASFCGDAIRNFRLLHELQRTSMDTVRTLVNAVDQKDPYTSGHSNRVGYYAMLLAAEMGLCENELRTLEWSALLHDIGKIGIRDDVLKKAGRLTDAEFEHIKEHPVRGYEVVRENPHMRESLDGVLHHHERYDGKGYPEGLSGERIPLQARIIQIADVFDALTTTRSYRNAYDWRAALEILKSESGSVVDPGLCDVFVRILERCHARNPAAFDAIGQAGVRLHLTGTGVPASHGVPS